MLQVWVALREEQPKLGNAEERTWAWRKGRRLATRIATMILSLLPWVSPGHATHLHTHTLEQGLTTERNPLCASPPCVHFSETYSKVLSIIRHARMTHTNQRSSDSVTVIPNHFSWAHSFLSRILKDLPGWSLTVAIHGRRTSDPTFTCRLKQAKPKASAKQLVLRLKLMFDSRSRSCKKT